MNQELFDKFKDFVKMCPRCEWRGIAYHEHSMYCYKEGLSGDYLDCAGDPPSKCALCEGNGFILMPAKILFLEESGNIKRLCVEVKGYDNEKKYYLLGEHFLSV